MIRWSFFPRNKPITSMGQSVVNVFELHEAEISSVENNHLIGMGSSEPHSNSVLEKISRSLTSLGFQVEGGKKLNQKIHIPVLYGEQGMPLKSFDADAFHKDERFVLEVEAGRAVTNYQFLKDYFQACVMVEVDYVAIAVRQLYKKQKDYETICNFFETLYASGRLRTALKGVLIIGY